MTACEISYVTIDVIFKLRNRKVLVQQMQIANASQQRLSKYAHNTVNPLLHDVASEQHFKKLQNLMS